MPLTKKSLADDAVAANDELTAFNIYDAVFAFDAVKADVANDAEIAFSTYDAVCAVCTNDAVFAFDAVNA